MFNYLESEAVARALILRDGLPRGLLGGVLVREGRHLLEVALVPGIGDGMSRALRCEYARCNETIAE